MIASKKNKKRNQLWRSRQKTKQRREKLNLANTDEKRDHKKDKDKPEESIQNKAQNKAQDKIEDQTHDGVEDRQDIETFHHRAKKVQNRFVRSNAALQQSVEAFFYINILLILTAVFSEKYKMLTKTGTQLQNYSLKT